MTKKPPYPPNNMKKFRVERNWTLRDMEQKTGWSNQVLSNLELSKSEMTWSKIQTLSNVFEVHPMEIMAMQAPKIPTPEQQEWLETVRGMEDGARETYLRMAEPFKHGAPKQHTNKKDDDEQKSG